MCTVRGTILIASPLASRVRGRSAGGGRAPRQHRPDRAIRKPAPHPQHLNHPSRCRDRRRRRPPAACTSFAAAWARQAEPGVAWRRRTGAQPLGRRKTTTTTIGLWPSWPQGRRCGAARYAARAASKGRGTRGDRRNEADRRGAKPTLRSPSSLVTRLTSHLFTSPLKALVPRNKPASPGQEGNTLDGGVESLPPRRAHGRLATGGRSARLWRGVTRTPRPGRSPPLAHDTWSSRGSRPNCSGSGRSSKPNQTWQSQPNKQHRGHLQK